MMEKVQCPVCTLFLHVGMNLSDHLETHPKEQVIKALVQMTVTRPLDDFKSLPSVEPVVGKQQDEDSLSQSPSSVVDKEKDRCSNSNTDSSSSVSLACAANNNLNFHLGSQQQKKRVSPTTTTAALFKHSGKHEFNTQNVTSSPAYQKSIGAFNLAAEIREGAVDVAKDVSSIPTGFSSFSNRCQLTSQIQQQQDTCSQSPPPQSEVDQKSTQLPFSGTSQNFHSKLQTQQHQLQFLTPAHQSNIQQHQHQRQLHQLPQHDSIKIFYSSSLPPPSPQIQVFSYQPPNQHLHQKPPPAYGAAISQIRSQYNHTKQTSLQQHQLHRSTTELMSVKVTSNSKSPILKKNVPPHQSLLSAAHHKQYPYAQQLQQQHHQQNQEQNYNQQQEKVQETDPNHQQQLPKNVANTVTPITFHKSGTYIPRGGPTSQVPPDVPISPFFGPQTSINRLTNSPFPPYLSTTMPSSSPCSSVLRYAESPVTAHYLERDNGDFIVQETPKHIVECVEKDNGEFSVIERIYQSPPSVLRIHDNDDEEENDMKEIIEKNKVKGEEVDTEDEEFMSIDGESELGEFPTELKPYEGNCKSSKEIIYHNQDKHTNTADAANSDSVVKAATNHPNNNNGLINSSRKKSSKNTITVLSDVQLNLNEYLDLVGNIIASSKIAKTQSFASAMPISLVKVEKVEPIDDYETEEQKQDAACLNESLSPNQQSVMHKKSAASSSQEPVPTTTTITTTTTIATTKSSTATDTTNNNIDKITETDLVAINCSNKEVSQYQPTTKIVSVNNSSSKNQVHSSHTTSVIRMASTTTSQKYVSEVEEQRDVSPKLKVQHNEDKSVSEKLIPVFKCMNHFALNESDAEDLSTQVQVKTEESNNNVVDASASLLTPIKRGPKKLVIKPKSNAIESKIFREESRTLICDEKPTSFICTQKRKADTETSDQEAQESKSIVIKSEPNISIETPSILEHHLRIPTNQSELKSETSSSRYETEISLKQECQQFSIKHERDEHNVSNQSEEKEIQMNRSSADQENENSRAVLDFTNSNKKEELEPASSNAPTFPSPNSIFGASNTEQSMLTNFAGSTSSTSAPCNMLETLRCNDEFIVPDATDVQEIVISSCYSSQSASDVALVTSNNQTDRNAQNQQSNNFADYPFSFLYGGGNVVNDIETKENLSPKYQQQTHDASTAVTLASGSNSATIGDITNDMIHRNAINNRFHQAVSASGRQWFQATSTSNTDFEAALAVDGGGCAEGSNAGNYLDLDSYKRLSMSGGGHLTATTLSSSLSSFTAATETSLAGCTPDALNIRTDEKMPEKGEISEQESNCDIETSWSQSMYGDIPVRFFKSSFPGLFPPENCWNNEEYFTVQDLSASGVTSVSNKATKSFDFRLPPENASSSTAVASSSSSTQQQQTQHIPAISCKKKRKRDSPAAKNSCSKTIASTVTLKDLQHQQQVQQQNFQQDLVQDPSLGYSQETPTTSAAVLAGASTIALAGLSNTANTANKRVAKVFTCVHCLMKFSKLKDRNHHMVDQHNYVLRNYRLIPLQKIVANEGSNIATTSNKTANLMGSSSSSTVTSFCSNIISTDQQIDIQVDSKRSIVKIELNQGEQAASTRFANSVEAIDQVLAKTEFVDEKDDLDLGSKIVATAADIPADPVFLPSLTRLYNLYHMLVSYNIAALKQNQTLSEADEKLILSSIFFCLICRQKFGSVKLYDAHMTEHPAECFTCGKKFHRWSNLSLHLKRHLGWKEFGCSVCDKKFVVRSALVEHMRMHTGQKPLKCNICEKHFKRFSNLAQHRKRHSKQILRKKEFVCFCGEVLPSKARFLWHKETHDAKPKCCPYCCDRFVHANSLRRHIRLAHSDKFDYTEPMECPMCKQVFAKSSIRAHMATHSMEMQHVCPICSKSFSTKWNLKIHSWVHANRTTKPFKCDHCPKAFVREVDFKNHINAHKQIKPYTCEYCGCKFIRKYNYMRHRREHHGNKKFTCDLCKKSFHRQYYLVEHRRIHTGERPFQCTICGKSSTTKTNHNKHLKIHHSRDPFTVEA